MNNKIKKRLIILISVILTVVVLCSLVGPYFVLNGARQPKVADKYAYGDYFYNSYDEVRNHLKDRVKKLRKKKIKVETSKYAVDKGYGVYIDNIYLPS